MLRSKLKDWERDFFEKNQRKPSSKDIKENKYIHGLYKQYHREKAAALKADPEPAAELKPEPDPETAEIPDVERTPQKPIISEVFPTPQHQGRVMGLFDIQLPATPVKKPDIPSTPTKAILVETPKSKRTPAYIGQRGSVVYDGESPLFPRRASKSISQIIEEVENMSDVDSDFELPPSPTQSRGVETPAVSETTDETSQPKWKKRGQKRTTKRVIMRPVTEFDAPSKRKATENYRRLNIQKKRPFGKRSR